MKSYKKKKIKVGIVGCGAIGSGIAKSIVKELKSDFCLSGLFDKNQSKAKELEQTLKQKRMVKKTLEALLKSCDLMVEAVSAKNTRSIIRQALEQKKHVLAMSVGQLLNAKSLFKLAHNHQKALLAPSGAIAGVDALKAARLSGIESVTLTTRKPPAGLASNSYISQQKINLDDLPEGETVCFEGSVEEAVKHFPQNINVAATIALATGKKNEFKVRIVTAPHYNTNSHEVTASGPFGKLTTKTENVPSPDNPKTSYLAVLSGIQTLKQFSDVVKIGS